LWGDDVDGDGTSDPYFNLAYPLADGVSGIVLRAPVQSYLDGDFDTIDAPVGPDEMDQFLYSLKFVAAVDPRPADLHLGFIPPPTGRFSGLAFIGEPVGVSRFDGAIMDNDFCADCRPFNVYMDADTVSQEVGHTLGLIHASCDHGEDEGGACEDDFHCPHGGICRPDADDPVFGFDPYGMHAVCLPWRVPDLRVIYSSSKRRSFTSTSTISERGTVPSCLRNLRLSIART
jgi:hypothetical protein